MRRAWRTTIWLHGRLCPNTIVAIVSATVCFALWITGPGISSNRSRDANSARVTVSPLMSLLPRSIANVLQKPLGRNHAAEPPRLGELIDTTRQGPKLVA